MKKIILIFLLFSNFCQSQTGNHKIFGIDLDLDFATLTNFQSVTYDLACWQHKDDPFIFTSFEHSYNQIEPKFINLGFTELLLGFQNKYKMDSTNVNTRNLKPELFVAKIYYSDLNAYKLKSGSDIKKILVFLKEKFGDAELNMVKDTYSVFKWNSVYFETILTCREDALSITFLCTKK